MNNNISANIFKTAVLATNITTTAPVICLISILHSQYISAFTFAFPWNLSWSLTPFSDLHLNLNKYIPVIYLTFLHIYSFMPSFMISHLVSITASLSSVSEHLISGCSIPSSLRIKKQISLQNSTFFYNFRYKYQRATFSHLLNNIMLFYEM
jgi:hypothetical protein